MNTTILNPVELKVFMNHVYEYKKGVRRMILDTMNKRYEDFAVKRLKSQGISFFIQRLGEDKINLFFGREECINVLRVLIDCPLNELSPEKDFILGTMLGYDVCGQCERYCKQLKRGCA